MHTASYMFVNYRHVALVHQAKVLCLRPQVIGLIQAAAQEYLHKHHSPTPQMVYDKLSRLDAQRVAAFHEPHLVHRRGRPTNGIGLPTRFVAPVEVPQLADDAMRQAHAFVLPQQQYHPPPTSLCSVCKKPGHHAPSCPSRVSALKELQPTGSHSSLHTPSPTFPSVQALPLAMSIPHQHVAQHLWTSGTPVTCNDAAVSHSQSSPACPPPSVSAAPITPQPAVAMAQPLLQRPLGRLQEQDATVCHSQSSPACPPPSVSAAPITPQPVVAMAQPLLQRPLGRLQEQDAAVPASPTPPATPVTPMDHTSATPMDHTSATPMDHMSYQADSASAAPVPPATPVTPLDRPQADFEQTSYDFEDEDPMSWATILKNQETSSQPIEVQFADPKRSGMCLSSLIAAQRDTWYAPLFDCSSAKEAVLSSHDLMSNILGSHPFTALCAHEVHASQMMGIVNHGLLWGRIACTCKAYWYWLRAIIQSTTYIPRAAGQPWPLSTQELRTVAGILDGAITIPAHTVLGNIPVYLSCNIQTLRDGAWVNDEVMNACTLLMRAMFHERTELQRATLLPLTFMHKLISRQAGANYRDLYRWLKHLNTPVDLIGLPVMVDGNHWIAVVIDFTNAGPASGGKVIVELMDPLYLGHSIRNDVIFDAVTRFLDAAWADRDSLSWLQHDPREALCINVSDRVPRQHDGYNCGIFTLCFLEHRLHKMALSYSTRDMPYFRKRLVLQLFNGKMLTDSVTLERSLFEALAEVHELLQGSALQITRGEAREYVPLFMPLECAPALLQSVGREQAGPSNFALHDLRPRASARTSMDVQVSGSPQIEFPSLAVYDPSWDFTTSSQGFRSSNPGLHVYKSAIGDGKGLFATRAFADGELMTEYAGNEICSKLDAAKLHIQTHMNHCEGLYVDGLKDPEPGKGMGSFAQHSPADKASAKVVRHGNTILLQCTRTVVPGDEVTLYYGPEESESYLIAMGFRRWRPSGLNNRSTSTVDLLHPLCPYDKKVEGSLHGALAQVLDDHHLGMIKVNQEPTVKAPLQTASLLRALGACFACIPNQENGNQGVGTLNTDIFHPPGVHPRHFADAHLESVVKILADNHINIETPIEDLLLLIANACQVHIAIFRADGDHLDKTKLRRVMGNVFGTGYSRIIHVVFSNDVFWAAAERTRSARMEGYGICVDTISIPLERSWQMLSDHLVAVSLVFCSGVNKASTLWQAIMYLFMTELPPSHAARMSAESAMAVAADMHSCPCEEVCCCHHHR